MGSLGEGEDFLPRCHMVSLDEDSMDWWHLGVINGNVVAVERERENETEVKLGLHVIMMIDIT